MQWDSYIIVVIGQIRKGGSLKGRYTFGNDSKQIINLKTDLVTSIGELLIV